MARVSAKENKNINQTTREGLKLTREAASELLETIAPEKYQAYKQAMQAGER